MKMNTLTRGILIPAFVAALTFMAGCATAPQETSAASQNTGRLVVTRSFSLGGLPVALLIDGQRVATVGFNQRYETRIPAGRHTLGIVLVRNTQRSRSEPFQLSVEPGKTYYFTATRQGPVVLLTADRGT